MTAEIINLADRLGAAPLQTPKPESEIEYAQRLIGDVIATMREGDFLGAATGLEVAARYLRRLDAKPQRSLTLLRSRWLFRALIRRRFFPESRHKLARLEQR